MVENHMIKITEGRMVNMLQQLDYQGAYEQEEEARAAGWGHPRSLTLRYQQSLICVNCLHRAGCGLASLWLSLPLGMAEKEGTNPGRWRWQKLLVLLSIWRPLGRNEETRASRENQTAAQNLYSLGSFLPVSLAICPTVKCGWLFRVSRSLGWRKLLFY